MDAILLGGGSGSRFVTPQSTELDRLPKQFRLLGTAPVFIHAVRSFLAMGCFRQIVVAVPRAFVQLAQDQMETYLEPQSQTVVRVVAGGDRRQDSSALALEAVEELSPPPTRVVIHDACRPYLSPEFLERVRDALLDRSYGAWVPVVPVVETLKRVDKDRVVETVDRQLIHRVQTPQIFEFTVIRSLAEKVKDSPEVSFTDDASLCEYYGIPVGVFEGDVKNIKLTYQFELEALRAMLEDGKKAVPCAPESATTFTV